MGKRKDEGDGNEREKGGRGGEEEEKGGRDGKEGGRGRGVRREEEMNEQEEEKGERQDGAEEGVTRCYFSRGPLSFSHRWSPRKTTVIFLLSNNERNCKQRWTNWTLLSPRLSPTSKSCD